MRLLVTGGGTAGHVYPALAIVEALLSNEEWATVREDVAWVGSADSIEERILARQQWTFHPIPVGALRGVNPKAALHNLGRMRKGYRRSRELVAQWRPHAVLATGGYVSVPLVLAARAASCPSLVFLPDMQPGLAVRLLSRFAQRVAVSFESVADRFPRRKVVVSGYPVRQSLQGIDKKKARDALNLAYRLPTLLVFGGSRGAHSINEAVSGVLEPLLTIAQVVHISGVEDYGALDSLRENLPSNLRSRYHLFSYMYEKMPDALAAATLAVARAGAATLGELPAVGLPAVLVPYPYAGQHQQLNAEYLAGNGAAVIVRDADLGRRVLLVVTELLADPERLRSMSASARALAVPEAATTVARELFSLAYDRL